MVVCPTNVAYDGISRPIQLALGPYAGGHSRGRLSTHNAEAVQCDWRCQVSPAGIPARHRLTAKARDARL